MDQELFDSLDDEWRRVAARRDVPAALAAWRDLCGPTAGPRSLDEAVRMVRAGDPAGQALARVLVDHADSDDLAARVLLQAVLPGLVRLERRSGRGDDDAAGTIVGLAWIRIRTYPKHRAGDVAANLYWDIRKQYLSDRSEPDVEPLEAAVEVACSAETTALAKLGVEELRGELDRLCGSPLPFHLLWSTRIEGRPSAEVARSCGMSRHGLVQRRRRAEQALARALSR